MFATEIKFSPNLLRRQNQAPFNRPRPATQANCDFRYFFKSKLKGKFYLFSFNPYGYYYLWEQYQSPTHSSKIQEALTNKG